MGQRGIEDVTRDLRDVSAGDAAAAERLTLAVYEELRGIAEGFFRRQPADHTLQPTALVHEAFLRLIDQTNANYANRAHFAAVASTAMRQILINHAERRNALKRGGDRQRVPLEEDRTPTIDIDHDLVALDEALTTLEAADARQARIVEMRFFGGLTVDEIAAVLGVSNTTVDNDWRTARAWLSRWMSDDGRPGS